MLSLHVHLCYRCCGCAHWLYSVNIIRGWFSWQNTDESGQVEEKTSKAETIDQAATVMVVSKHSIHSMWVGNKGDKPFHSTVPSCLYSTQHGIHATLYPAKVTEVWRWQLRAFILTFSWPLPAANELKWSVIKQDTGNEITTSKQAPYCLTKNGFHKVALLNYYCSVGLFHSNNYSNKLKREVKFVSDGVYRFCWSGLLNFPVSNISLTGMNAFTICGYAAD